jgi:hypothetical protein
VYAVLRTNLTDFEATGHHSRVKTHSALVPAVFAALAALACSSAPASPAVGSGGSATSGGQTSSAAGANGAGVGGGAGSTSAGAGGKSAGAAGAGNGGTLGGAGSASGGTSTAGSSGASGAAGMAATAGSGGGAPVDPGNLPDMKPAGYTGMPFGGTPQIIPGKIEIEKYDLGGANVAYKADPGGAFNKCGFMREDALKLQCTQQAGSPADKSLPGCGMEPAGEVYLGYIGAGNWYKYSVNVVEAGTYVISGHEGVAGNTQMQFTFTDTVKTGNITLPSTDQCAFEAYHVWAVHDKLGEITLAAGKYVLTINVVAAAMNLDWFAFTKK